MVQAVAGSIPVAHPSFVPDPLFLEQALSPHLRPMSSPQQELPALPIVLVLAVAAFAVMLWLLHRRGGLTVPRVLVSGAACLYGAGVLANTIFPIYVGGTGSPEDWTVFLNLEPLADTETFDMVQNVLVFLPLGILLPLVGRVRSIWRVLLFGFLLSLSMEAIQLLNAVTGHGGHIADINDLVANTIGAPIGYCLYLVISQIPVLGGWLDACTWPPRREARSDP